MRDDEQHLRHAHCQFELQTKKVSLVWMNCFVRLLMFLNQFLTLSFFRDTTMFPDLHPGYELGDVLTHSMMALNYLNSNQISDHVKTIVFL